MKMEMEIKNAEIFFDWERKWEKKNFSLGKY